MTYLIDRRLQGKNKSAVNRERFLRRYKAQIQDAVKKMIGERKLADMEQGGEVRIPRKDISEPTFTFGRGGDREIVLPGNREYIAGDRIPRPEGQGGRGGNASEGGEGESHDEFVFSLSREEFMQIFFDDLELPNLMRTELGRAEKHTSVRAGYAKTGTPANLAVIRTLSQSLARRIALGGGLRREMQDVETQFKSALAVGHAEEAARLYTELLRLGSRRSGLPILEDHDLRVRAWNRSGQSQPMEALWQPAGYMRNVVESVKVTAA